MNINQVNEIFKTKYVNGQIYQKNSNGYVNTKTKICVIFDKTKTPLKTFGYYVSNYVELLTKLGFNVIYQKDVDFIQNRIIEMETELKNGFIQDDFFGNFELTAIEKQKRENDIKEYQQKLKNAIIINK